MKLIFLISVLFFLSPVQAESNDDVQNFLEFVLKVLEAIASKVHLHPDTGLNIDQFLDKYDYTLENHYVTTSDDYILTMHRIPNGRNENADKNSDGTNKPVVLLVHGLSSSSMDWLIQGPNSSLPLLLADLGYDVWLANLRGSTYSAHKTLTRKDPSFWDYTFHERGYYDLSASIDYILTATSMEKITYIGHSEGTTNGLVLTSTIPDYNDKINLMALLSPVAYMGNLESPYWRMLSENENIFKLIMNVLNINGIPYSPLITTLVDVFCNDDSSMQGLCTSALGLIFGFDNNQLNRSLLTVYFSNAPGGHSIKEIDHFLQECNSGYFRQYDYGSIANLLHYGSDTPPSYDIKKITVPLAFYYAKNDLLSSTLDVEKFIYQLSGDTADRLLIEDERFNYLDFLIAKDVKELLYDQVIQVIQKYNPVDVA